MHWIKEALLGIIQPVFAQDVLTCMRCAQDYLPDVQHALQHPASPVFSIRSPPLFGSFYKPRRIDEALSAGCLIKCSEHAMGTTSTEVGWLCSCMQQLQSLPPESSACGPSSLTHKHNACAYKTHARILARASFAIKAMILLL